MPTELLNQLRTMWPIVNPPPQLPPSSPLPSSPLPSLPPSFSASPPPPTTLQPAAIASKLGGGALSANVQIEPQIASLPLSAALPVHQPQLTAGHSLPVFIDLETRSSCDLRRLGGRAYAAHSTTQIISAVVVIDQQAIVWLPTASTEFDASNIWPSGLALELPTAVFTGPKLPEPILVAIAAGRPFCAHNAFGFDALVWRGQQLPEPSQWIDTAPLARAAGLPGKLDTLAFRLFGLTKDKEGKELVKRLNREARRGIFNPINSGQLRTITRYNIQDAVLLAGVYQLVHNFGEADVLAVDRAINERGVGFDIELAQKLAQLWAMTASCTEQEIADVTGGKVTGAELRRVEFLRNWLAKQGVALPNLKRHSIEDVLNSEMSFTPAVHKVLSARLASGRTVARKLETAIVARGADGRLRDQFKYHGAHTGRWSGKHVQLQNLPRPHPHLEDPSRLLELVDMPEEFLAAMPAGLSLADGVSALIRPCFRPAPGNVFCIADFAGIEARGVAWCAGEHRQLELFAQGGDNYCDLASEIFGRLITSADKAERAVGKVAVLGCGYGMGWGRFAATCQAMHVDLAAANTTAEAVVEAYRERYPAIAGRRSASGHRKGGLWKQYENAARLAIEGRGPIQAGKCTFVGVDGDLIVRLPGGRLFFYRNARIEPVIEEDDSLFAYDGWERTQIVFDSPTSTNISTYGGKLTENLVSATCRDLLARALVGCEAEGLKVVVHVHDEIVVEAPIAETEQTLQKLLTIMSMPPAWAEGLPIEVEGFVANRYFKTPPEGSVVKRARAGKLLPSPK